MSHERGREQNGIPGEGSAEIFPETAARVAEWSAQPEVLGVVLVGSKSRGHADGLSDDDLEVLMTDEAAARIPPSDCLVRGFRGEGNTRKLVYDVQLTTLSDLKRKATSPMDLDRWPYERAQVLFDREGQTARAVMSAGHMDADFRAARLRHATIDTMVAVGREAKTRQRGYSAACGLLASRAARGLARILFALEWRWVPLDHWLEAELQTLQDPAGAAPALLEALITRSAAPVGPALSSLEDRLYDEGVPRAAQRLDLFLELIHPSNHVERALHGLQ